VHYFKDKLLLPLIFKHKLARKKERIFRILTGKLTDKLLVAQQQIL